MIRRPPRSTRTDTLLPYTTLFRSGIYNIVVYCAKAPAGSGRDRDRESSTRRRGRAPRFSSGRTGIGNRPGLVLDAESEAVAPGPMRPLQGLPALPLPVGRAVRGEVRAHHESGREIGRAPGRETVCQSV